MIGEDNFSLEVLFIDEEEVRCEDGKEAGEEEALASKTGS